MTLNLGHFDMNCINTSINTKFTINSISNQPEVVA